MAWTDYLSPVPGVGKMINSFLHPEEGYQKAEEAANRGYGEGIGYEKPYYQGGLDQYGRLNQATGDLLNPEAMENKWAAGYEMSPYAKRELEMNRGQGLDAASSMGLMGSSAAVNNIQRGAADITAQDRQQYLNDLMQKYLAGIGLGQNLYGVGANTAAVMGTQAINQGNVLGGLEYNKQVAPGAMFGKLLGTGLNYVAPGLGSGLTGVPATSSLQGATNTYNA